ncbi:hypothetical protein LIER_31549 [Lithospermum erythrorhizon]|uniref:Uncharacterized protein n=1 Tax=Lithospermum erythrorhizon TaxID=34254 RepID=A0AAV3RWM6_LITER
MPPPRGAPRRGSRASLTALSGGGLGAKRQTTGLVEEGKGGGEEEREAIFTPPPPPPNVDFDLLMGGEGFIGAVRLVHAIDEEEIFSIKDEELFQEGWKRRSSRGCRWRRPHA